MRNFGAGLAFLCAALAATWGVAEQERPYATALTDLEETLAPAAKVSNDAIIVAVLAGDAFSLGAQAFDGEFEVFVPKQSQLCITYHTQNGLYEGKQVFSSNETGWVRVRYRSRERDDLFAYGEESFAVRALVTQSCSEPSRGAPLTIARSVEAGKDFFAIVHADGQPATVAVYQKGVKEALAKEPCEIFNNIQSVRFDRKCKIPPEAFRPGTRTALILRLPGKIKVHRLRVVQSEDLYAALSVNKPETTNEN